MLVWGERGLMQVWLGVFDGLGGCLRVADNGGYENWRRVHTAMNTRLGKFEEKRNSTQSQHQIRSDLRCKTQQRETYSSSKAHLAAPSSPGCFARKGIIL